MAKFNKFGNFICKHRAIIIVIAILLLIPSILGIKATRINYDILTYLPRNVETIEGQSILSKDFNIGSYSILLVDKEMTPKDVLKMENKIKEIDCVDKVVGVYDVLGTTVPLEMVPEDIQEKISADGETPIIVTFRTGIGDDATLKAIEDIRDIAKKQCMVSGMSAISQDIKDILNSEMALYVIVAVILCIIVLLVGYFLYLWEYLLD